MNRTRKYILLSLALLNFTIAGVSDAAAYLDPGTGSLIIQSLIGLIAGVAVFGRNLVHNVASKAKNLFSKESTGTAQPNSEPKAE